MIPPQDHPIRVFIDNSVLIPIPRHRNPENHWLVQTDSVVRGNIEILSGSHAGRNSHHTTLLVSNQDAGCDRDF